MILRRCLVAENVRRTAVSGDHCIQPAVVVQIADSHPTTDPLLFEHIAGLRGHIHEGAVAHVPRQQHRLLIVKLRIVQLDCIQIVALRDQQVFEAVVVVVEKMNAPSGMQKRHARKARDIRVIGERAVAVVAIQRVLLVCEIRDDQVRQTIVVEVLEVDAHTRVSAAITVNGDLRREPLLLERAIAVVVIEELGHGVVRDCQIDLSIPIEIGDCDTQPLPRSPQRQSCSRLP